MVSIDTIVKLTIVELLARQISKFCHIPEEKRIVNRTKEPSAMKRMLSEWKLDSPKDNISLY